uniref:BZIP domain-containing protein n=1 Tax=Taeniopygia guttata TaxID=59729 RepID=A0A674HCH2_TAEGU
MWLKCAQAASSEMIINCICLDLNCTLSNGMQMAFLFALFTSAFCREAAKECRRRKKEYIKCLESRVAVLEVQNKKLIQELETLKDICSSKTD